jgi:hypothetical protein
MTSQVTQIKIKIPDNPVFNDAVVQACMYVKDSSVRAPTLSKINKKKSEFMIIAQCRGNTKGAGGVFHTLDDFSNTQMIYSTSTDGLKWNSKPTVFPGVALSKPSLVFDEFENQLVMQYNDFSASVNPDENLGVFQVTSKDGGKSWSSAKNITSFIESCNAGPKDRVRLSAGNHCQTPQGRLVFGGMNRDQICVWYSDDGGKTYNTSQMVVGSENSIAATSGKHLFMTTRGGKSGWAPSRTGYFSVDGGVTWGDAVQMPIQDESKEGCSASVLAMKLKRGNSAKDVIFYSGPMDPVRLTLGIHCSWDGGKSWPYNLVVNKGERAGYSVMEEIVDAKGNQKLLVAWEKKPNILSHVFDLDWCQDPANLAVQNQLPSSNSKAAIGAGVSIMIVAALVYFVKRRHSRAEKKTISERDDKYTTLHEIHS